MFDADLAVPQRTPEGQSSFLLVFCETKASSSLSSLSLFSLSSFGKAVPRVKLGWSLSVFTGCMMRTEAGQAGLLQRQPFLITGAKGHVWPREGVS